MQQYKEERWDDIMNGRNVHKYDRSEMIMVSPGSEKQMRTKMMRDIKKI